MNYNDSSTDAMGSIYSVIIPLQGKGYTRGVTKPQFERLMHFLSLKVTPEEMKVSRVPHSNNK